MSTRRTHDKHEGSASLAVLAGLVGAFILWRPHESATVMTWACTKVAQVLAALVASPVVRQVAVAYFVVAEALIRWAMSGFLAGR